MRIPSSLTFLLAFPGRPTTLEWPHLFNVLFLYLVAQLFSSHRHLDLRVKRWDETYYFAFIQPRLASGPGLSWSVNDPDETNKNMALMLSFSSLPCFTTCPRCCITFCLCTICCRALLLLCFQLVFQVPNYQ